MGFTGFVAEKVENEGDNDEEVIEQSASEPKYSEESSDSMAPPKYSEEDIAMDPEEEDDGAIAEKDYEEPIEESDSEAP